MSKTRRELDLRTLPLAEGAEALRSLAQANLAYVLRGGPATTAATGSVSHVAELIHLLETEARLAEQSAAVTEAWYQQADATLSRELACEQPPAEGSSEEEEAGGSAAPGSEVDTAETSSDGSEAAEESDEPRAAVPEWRPKLERQAQTGLMIEVARLQRQASIERRAGESDTVAPEPADAAAGATSSPEPREALGVLARLVRFLRRLVGFDSWSERPAPEISSSEIAAAPRVEAPQPVLPENVWGYVCSVALDDPRFVMDCSKAVRAALRETFVMTPGAEPLPEIHPNTHWALQLLVPADRIDEELARRDLARLHDEAARRVRSARWAGFWDQWLIHRAFRKVDEKTPPTESLELLRGLPWVVAGGVPAKDEPANSRLAKPGWENQRPDWLDPRNCM